MPYMSNLNIIYPLFYSLVKEQNYGDEEIRTPDLFIANEALYQLSYVPNTNWATMESNHGPQSYQDCALTN